ncbi:hypothetical protein MNBD_UNCLBAC01-875 [hydrothermal vent metagenome]|uniref:Trimeric autotransporter adhesin YadA-like head domain-containing protein n=1 Tax=hydrothermal vent metagenome TaxID=652676 RepID=A0A3B1E1E8_9ZZZZ
MKKIILSLLFLLLTTASFAQTKSIELTTYYPAPFGSYDRLRLVPRAALTCDSNLEGLLYYNNINNRLEVCQADGSFSSISGNAWTQDVDGNGDPIIYPNDNDPDLFVGIGTETPEFKLSLAQDGGIIATGTFGSGVDYDTTGSTTMFLWYPKKAAFRAGYVDTDQWNDNNIGDYSIAFGENTQANNTHSVVSGGLNNIVLDNHSTVSGGKDNSIADGPGYSVIGGGDSNVITGGRSTIAGGWGGTINGGGLNTIGGGGDNLIDDPAQFATITGGRDNVINSSGYATVGGDGNLATGAGGRQTVFGELNTASATLTTISGGKENTASAWGATVPGGQDNVASGQYSLAAGRGSHAGGDYSVALGRNLQLSASAEKTFIWGYSSTSQIVNTPEAFIIYSGNVGIGTIEPKQKLHINAVMQLEPLDSSSAPTCDENGILYVSSSGTGALCYCNGTSWNVAASDGGGSCP